MVLTNLFKRWKRMLSGKSNFHVPQSEGQNYSFESIRGYYNDLSGKINSGEHLDEAKIPFNKTAQGEIVHYPITVFQYGLGLYELYLKTGKNEYLAHCYQIADWALNEQLENGMWDCMAILKDSKHKSQSAMCQGEGVSLLLRVYIQSHDQRYLDGAKSALNFMLLPIDQGGTTLYRNKDIFFEEYVSEYNLHVLNGWIFSIFGLLDYAIFSQDERYKQILNSTIETLKRYLPVYSRKYWSNYDARRTIASPAYHSLHIELLKVIYKYTNDEQFSKIISIFSRYKDSKCKKNRAIFVKLIQKIFKRKYYDIGTTLID